MLCRGETCNRDGTARVSARWPTGRPRPLMESGVQAARDTAAGAAGGPRALTAAVDEAVSGLQGSPVQVIAFPSGFSAEQLASQLEELEGIPVAGLTGNGAISAAGAIETGCSAIAFGGETRAGVGVVTEAGGDLRAGARAATEAALGELEDGSDRTAVLLFLDTRTGDQSQAIAGAYAAAGPAVPLAGGAAGGAAPAQIASSRVHERSVVALALARPGPIGVGTAHGCRPIGAPAIVTRSRGRMVLELDGSPAVDAYLSAIGFAGVPLDEREFELLAVTHPLAQPELSGDERVRHVLGREGQALILATHIPENAAVLFTRETPADVVGTAGQAVSESLAALRGARARAALLFDCAGRKRAAGAEVGSEVAALLGAFGPPRPPLAGLFTHGEVARTRGAKGDRNHAIVVVTFA